jgi:hypothetical protein
MIGWPRLLLYYADGQQIDIRELVIQVTNTDSARTLGGARMAAAELARLYRVNEALSTPTPARIIVFDDVLTSGAHFKAMQSVLSERFPGAQILGLFVARTVQM